MLSHKHLLNLFENQENKFEFFISLSYEDKIFILENINLKNKTELISNLPDIEIIEIFERLDPDQVTDILQGLDNKKKAKVYLQLNKDLKLKVDFLLKFAPNSAAGIMSLNYIHVNVTTSKKEIIERIKKHIDSGKKEPTILVLDKKNHFIGELKISKLLIEKNQEDLFSNLKILPTIRYNEKQEECIFLFRRNKNEKVVVLDDDDYILGIIHSKDIFKVIEEEETQNFYAVSGVHKDEEITDTAIDKVKFRLRWLVISLFALFLSAYVISMFTETISKIVIIASFMPIIAGLGGNAGAQTTAIMVRSFALKKVDSNIIKKILFSELTAGAINGIILGLIITIFAYFFNQELLLGLVVGLAIFLNLIIASFFGTIIPYLLEKFNFDPAVSSSAFVTTLTDVLGFAILLVLATKILI